MVRAGQLDEAEHAVRARLGLFSAPDMRLFEALCGWPQDPAELRLGYGRQGTVGIIPRQSRRIWISSMFKLPRVPKLLRHPLLACGAAALTSWFCVNPSTAASAPSSLEQLMVLTGVLDH